MCKLSFKVQIVWEPNTPFHFNKQPVFNPLFSWALLPCDYRASERCHQEKRKTINGEDILFAMSTLGFDNYVEPLKAYLQKYREVSIAVLHQK